MMPALRAIYLFVLMCIGAILGTGCGAAILVPIIHGYDHGHGETESCGFIGAMIGAFVGLAVYLKIPKDDAK